MIESSLGIGKLRYPHVIEACEALIDLGYPAVIHGPPGVGKTRLMKDLGARLNMHVETATLSQMDAVAMYGMRFPNTETGQTEQFPPDLLPKPDDERRWLIFFDELGNVASPAVRMGVMQLLDQYRIGRLEVDRKKHWIAAAMNLGAEDGVTNVPLDAMAADRLVHLRVELTLIDWITGFADPNRILPQIVGYLRSHPTEFNPYDQKAAGQTVRPTPRSWEKTHHEFMAQIQQGKKPEEFMELPWFKALVAGTISESTMTSFFAYCKNAEHFAMVDQLANAKSEAELKSLMPKTPQGLYTLSSAFHRHVKDAPREDVERITERTAEVCVQICKIGKDVPKGEHFLAREVATWCGNMCLNAMVENPHMKILHIKKISESTSPKMAEFCKIAQVQEALAGEELDLETGIS